MSNIDPEAFGNAMGELIRKRFEEESHHVDERLKRLVSFSLRSTTRPVRWCATAADYWWPPKTSRQALRVAREKVPAGKRSLT